MIRKHRLFSSLVAAAGLLIFAGATLAAKPEGNPGNGNSQSAHQKKAHHQDGKQLLGEKIKTNGRHAIDKKGDVTAAVEVKDGKIVGLHANHAKKGELPVKKYKSSQKMVRADGLQGAAHFMTVQDQYVGTTYIGYAYIDDYGDEQIYWFPVDMIYDGDTGAIEYVPIT
jgi:hypothetical protein